MCVCLNDQDFIGEQREAWAEVDATNAERQKRIERKRQGELATIRAQKTKDLRLRMVLPNFENLVAHAKVNGERGGEWGRVGGLRLDNNWTDDYFYSSENSRRRRRKLDCSNLGRLLDVPITAINDYSRPPPLQSPTPPSPIPPPTQTLTGVQL